MKLKGKISMYVSGEHTRIEIEDANGHIRFLEIVLTPEQFSRALGREAYVDCELEVRGLEKVGKQHEHKTFEFELPEGMSQYSRDDKELQKIAQSKLSDGWIADSYFSSQNTFFEVDGKEWARCSIRRWVDKPNN